jgi:hypothetical protein
MRRTKPSNDLKAADFKGQNLKVTIDGVGERTYEGREDRPEQVKTTLTFVGKEKTLVCSDTNNNILCDAYGDDSDGWIGKEIGLSTKTWNFGEGDKEGWIVTPLDVEPPEFSDDIPF